MPRPEARVGPEVALLTVYEIGVVGCRQVCTQTEEAGHGRPDAARHIDVVARSGTRSSQNPPPMHRPDGRDVDGEGTRGAGDVPANECHSIPARQGQEAVHDAVQAGDLQGVGQHERQQHGARTGAHGRQVAEIGRERPMADGVRRHEPAVEMDAVDKCVRGDDVEGAPLGLDHGGVVARADDDPAGHHESCGDAGNEGVLAEVGDGAISHEFLASHPDGAEVAPLCRVGRSNEPA